MKKEIEDAVSAKVLTMDDILSSQVNLEIEPVLLSGNRKVYVREMTGTEKNKWELACMKKVAPIGNQKETMTTTLENYYSKMVVFALCDPQGNRLFDNSWLLPSKLEQLGSKFKATDFEKLVNAGNRINKITQEDQEVLMGNSEADLATGSGSGSV